MTDDRPDILAFGDVELDLARGELRRDGAPVTVEPQVLDLIGYLASHPGVVVTRDALIDAVWGGRAVSDSAIATRINAARSALGDDGTTQKVIRTIPRRGFRFEAAVGAPAGSRAQPGADKPSVAVLPFSNMSGDAEQRYFSDGITDDIITDLSRYDELHVIPRHASFTHRDSDLSPAEISNTLGAQYLVEGSVRRAGDRVRVTVQLIEPAANIQRWAERYDRDVEDIFAVQDEIATVIVNTLAGHITRQHYKRVAGRPEEAVHAYDHLLRATEHALRVAPADNTIAREAAQRAVEIDPSFARAYAILTLTYINEGNNFWTAEPAKAVRLGYEAASKAVAIDSRDPWSQAMLGIAELWETRDYIRSVSYMERAVELNPSNAYFRGLFSYVLPFCGEPDRALEVIDDAMHRNPLFPPVFHGFRGRALLFLGKAEEALSCLGQMATLMPGHSNALAYSAICHASTGRRDIARQLVAQLVGEFPYYRLGLLRQQLPYKRPEDLSLVLDLLAEAGLPEA